MAHTTTHAGSGRHPGNLAWLLEKVADYDVHRDTHYQYRVHLGPELTVLCTEEIEAIAQPIQRRGHWTPPLVKLRRDGLVEITTAGCEKLTTLTKGAKTATPKPATSSRRLAGRKPTLPVFQPAAA